MSPKQTPSTGEPPNGWHPPANGFQTDFKRQEPRKSALQTDQTDSANLTAASLRQAIAAIEAACIRKAPQSARMHVETGLPAIDETLSGGLHRGTVHEVLPKSMQDLGTASGFAFGLAARANQAHAPTLYIQHDFTVAETGRPYLPGLKLAGFDAASLIYLHVPRPEDVVWAMSEALKCRGFSTVIAEFPSHARVLDLTATRRLTLAAQEGMGFGVILRHTGTIEPNAATTRWFVSAAPSRADRFGGIGPARFHLDLVKNRFGPCGQWQVEWHPHERKFTLPALPGSLARPFAVRPDRTHPFAKAG